MTLQLAFLALCLSLTSSIMGAVLALFLCRSWLRRVLRGASLKSIAELALKVEELTSLFSALHESHRKLVSRVGMRALREDRAAENSPTKSKADSGSTDWKRQMRAKMGQLLASGRHPTEVTRDG